jgi:type II secretory pathway component PulF
MKNPYEPPLSELKDQSAPSNAGLLQFISGVALAFISALIPTIVTPSFESVFVAFGTELPIATQFFIDYHLMLWSLPILVILVHFFWPKKKNHSFSLLLGIFSLVLTIPFMIWVLYTPFFPFGQAL